jgi:hypothetical protein
MRGRAWLALVLAVPSALLALPLALAVGRQLLERVVPPSSMRATMMVKGHPFLIYEVLFLLAPVAAVALGLSALRQPRAGVAVAAIVMGSLSVLTMLAAMVVGA